jgi:selenide,water dikinase
LRSTTLAEHTHPDLLVGLHTSDDAAVFRLRDDLVMIQTLDFFSPIVDDPFTFGGIAAANSMSDIYAMGGEVTIALNIAGFPSHLPGQILAVIMDGGAAKVAEAGGVIAGGHTVDDAEPKYGLCVTGLAHPSQVLTKAGASPGDRLFLSKPLGTGIITTAIKRDAAERVHADAAIRWMLALNRDAARAAAAFRPHACTDITGFGLLGHGSEMAEKSDVALHIEASAVPIMDGARAYAEAGHLAGGLGRNRDHFANSGGVTVDGGVPDDVAAVLWDPQTSGGLLFSVDASSAPMFRQKFVDASVPLWEIGAVSEGAGVYVRP